MGWGQFEIPVRICIYRKQWKYLSLKVEKEGNETYNMKGKIEIKFRCMYKMVNWLHVGSKGFWEDILNTSIIINSIIT